MPFETQSIRIMLLAVSREALWNGAEIRSVYYIDAHNRVVSKRIDAASKSIDIAAKKGGALPALVCATHPKTRSGAAARGMDEFSALLTAGGSAACPFALGAVYPYEATGPGVMNASGGVSAAAARMLLIFAGRGGNTHALNAAKLYEAAKKYAAPYELDAAEFLDHARRGTLSLRAVKPRAAFTVFVPPPFREWFRSWIQPAENPARLDEAAGTVNLASGMWLFVEPGGARYATVSVSTLGAVSFMESQK